jgi:hypothetical protein
MVYLELNRLFAMFNGLIVIGQLQVNSAQVVMCGGVFGVLRNHAFQNALALGITLGRVQLDRAAEFGTGVYPGTACKNQGDDPSG